MAAATNFLAGHSVLVVDDEPLIAHDIADFLHGHGAEVIGPCHGLHEAMDCLERTGETTEIAVLDVQIGRECVWPLADELQRRSIPFVFVSAHCGTDSIAERFRSATCLSKPIDFQALEALLNAALAPR